MIRPIGPSPGEANLKLHAGALAVLIPLSIGRAPSYHIVYHMTNAGYANSFLCRQYTRVCGSL